MKTTIALLCALTIPMLATASHSPIGECTSDGNPALGIVEVQTVPGGSGIHGPNPSGAFYVDDRNLVLGQGLWIYEESNGIYTPGGDAPHNLQRGGVGLYTPDNAETCVDDPNVIPDTIVF